MKMSKTLKRQRLQHTVKVGIIKQLYKDHKITDIQYKNLLFKYGKKGEES
ncbi:MAG: hypothetical protein FWD47_14985 [Treponema sp.]|nr:hypothetical protein [Treponema sp.]